MELTKRQLQKENTKKKIIETAYLIYANQGFQATTSDIARAAHVSHGTIFVHFPTLNDLLICLLQEFNDAIGTKLHMLSVGEEGIKIFLDNHINVLQEYEEFYRRFITEMNLLPEAAKSTFIAIQSTVSFHFNKVVQREINCGAIKDIPMHMLFNTWIGLIHYYLQNKEFFAPNSSVLERYKIELINSYLELIKL